MDKEKEAPFVEGLDQLCVLAASLRLGWWLAAVIVWCAVLAEFSPGTIGAGLDTPGTSIDNSSGSFFNFFVVESAFAVSFIAFVLVGLKRNAVSKDAVLAVLRGCLGFRKALLSGSIWGVATTLVAIALVMLVKRGATFHPLQGWEMTLHTLGAFGAVATMAIVAILIALAASAEEIIFRAWLQTRLQQWLGLPGAGIAAPAFYAVHLDGIKPAVIPVVMASIVLTWLRYRYAALFETISAHTVTNIVIIGFNNAVSWKVVHP
jgi:membrane protease YdiL (CAAX protease family)